LLATAATLLSACRVMARVAGTHDLLAAPTADEWHRVIGALVVTILPFEHPRFPRVAPEAVHAELRRLFRVDDDPDFAMLPRAVMLFDDAPAFEAAPAPFVDDQMHDLAQSRLAPGAIGPAIDTALARDHIAWSAYESRHGRARFVDLPVDSRRAYLSLWSASELVTRRRFYHGAKSLVCVTAYSMRPFWDAVGYEGPLLGRS
jgi:hypothetical protein